MGAASNTRQAELFERHQVLLDLERRHSPNLPIVDRSPSGTCDPFRIVPGFDCEILARRLLTASARLATTKPLADANLATSSFRFQQRDRSSWMLISG